MNNFAGDTDLLEALRKGDSSAFRKVYLQYFSMVRYLIINNSGREEDASDIFQEAMIVLYEQVCAGTFTQQSSLKTWIYAVCRNKWLKQLEKRKRNIRFHDFEKTDSLLIAEENTEDDWVHQQLRKSLEQLGVPCRKLLLLFYYFRKSMEEIASDLNYTNADNAKAQKYKCLQKLKSFYKNAAAG